MKNTNVFHGHATYAVYVKSSVMVKVLVKAVSTETCHVDTVLSRATGGQNTSWHCPGARTHHHSQR